MKLSQDKNLDALMKIGGSIALFFLGKKAFAKGRKSGAEADMDTNPSTGQAASLKQAMNPSGFRWMRFIDGTDKDAIFRVAGQITNLDDVKAKYKGLTDGGELYDDLEGSLSPDEFQKFLSLSTKGKAGSYYYAKKSENVPKNRWILTIKEANIRTSPKYINRNFPNHNIIKTVKPGVKLGGSTGNYVYDEKNKVLFVEFWTLSISGVKKTFFVAKSQIEFITTDELAKREKSGKLPLVLFSGIAGQEIELSGIDPQQKLVTRSTALIYNENFQQVGLANKNTVLGFPIMTLDTGKGSFTQFETLQGQKRWVRSENARIENP